ncbi:hypothetical protein J7T55_002795 [Diaporthe amygdali]|uniref:uncharacterized protein n=1 Tax=Phomopsis amygdali TaxID=1214568 RepID=UPI0022FE5282|nr:uncharacterized protein J7T55_002795 [Diaporthe amygdali]KAJ0122283.1 hypothetical protein J7T55_002795 [Diaporthe amygdali]
MLSHAIVALIVAAAPALAIPPPIFGLPTSDYDAELSVAYTLSGNTTVLQAGQLFGGNITQDQPALALDPLRYPSVASYEGQYVIVMCDPDATTPDNPDRRFILHWLAPNMTTGAPYSATRPQTGVALTNMTENFTPYRSPGPALNSSAHRYILYAFRQPDTFTVPAEFDTYAGGVNRTGFNLTSFIELAGLGNPAAAEYMYVSREPAVPGDFVALPGDLVPLPQCDGLKRRPAFTCLQNRYPGHFYALKLVREITPTTAAYWLGPDPETTFEVLNYEVKRTFYNHTDPFSNEYRAFGRLQEAGHEQLAVKCFGYWLLDEQHERIIMARFPQVRHGLNANADQRIVKERRSHFHSSGARPAPIRGILSDFSAAITTPHFVANPELIPRLSVMELETSLYSTNDYLGLEDLAERWNWKHTEANLLRELKMNDLGRTDNSTRSFCFSPIYHTIRHLPSSIAINALLEVFAFTINSTTCFYRHVDSVVLSKMTSRGYQGGFLAIPSFKAQSSSQTDISLTLEKLQTDEQRRVLDTVSQVRKCGLESVLSLPQIVVCGDQSAGKSSVLEALTEIPFPRNDNLCTRFATEICLRRDPVNSLTIRVIPDSDRPQKKQEQIKRYSESTTDLKDLPRIMGNAKKVMGISEGGNAFAKDTLSIEICGPDRPQLTLVDIPGLIQTSTKGVSDADVAMVAEITDHYIEQPRTICLAVISATNDAANQAILQRVRKFDPHGDRTLGVITKPDRLSAGSGSETKFLELARNEDVFFKLGWHVTKNRKFEEKNFSLEQRNQSEKDFFKASRFNTLPKENVGIDALRVRLSYLLFEHVKHELPRLQKDLESALQTAQNELKTLGTSRSTAAECRTYLTQLNMECYEICRAAVDGNYEHRHFTLISDDIESCSYSVTDTVPVRRLRACVQMNNRAFAEDLEAKGHKYDLDTVRSNHASKSSGPRALSGKEALGWVGRKLQRARGTELIGNFNPKVIGELFWEQSSPWEGMAKAHVERINTACVMFLANLLESMTTHELKSRIWAKMVADVLKSRKEAALQELERLIKDKKAVPINYNHYYTDNVHKKRGERIEAQLKKYVPQNTSPASSTSRCSLGTHYYQSQSETKDQLERAISKWKDSVTADMEEFSCEESLDCLDAIYKVQLKVFVANVTTQVIERHLLAELYNIFSPMTVLQMSDAKIQGIVSEPESTKRRRDLLSHQINKLEEGQEIFRGVMDP